MGMAHWLEGFSVHPPLLFLRINQLQIRRCERSSEKWGLSSFRTSTEFSSSNRNEYCKAITVISGFFIPLVKTPSGAGKRVNFLLSRSRFSDCKHRDGFSAGSLHWKLFLWMSLVFCYRPSEFSDQNTSSCRPLIEDSLAWCVKPEVSSKITVLPMICKSFPRVSLSFWFLLCSWFW